MTVEGRLPHSAASQATDPRRAHTAPVSHPHSCGQVARAEDPFHGIAAATRRRAERTVERTPGVDLRRVAAVRAALDQRRYQVNAQRVALAFLRHEALVRATA